MTETFKTEPETKEVSVVKQQAMKALTAANELEIKAAEDMPVATDLLSKMKTVARMVKERREAITKPLMEALGSARDLFKPIEANLADAERVVKGKMLAYQAEADRKAEADRVKIAERVERGTMKAATAVARMEKIEDAPTSVQGKVGAVAFRTVRKVRFSELRKLEGGEIIKLALGGYLEWNETAARTDALAGKNVVGVEVYEEKMVASSSILEADSPLLGQK